jgi:hypothetical protein
MAIETNAIVLLEVTNPQCRLAQPLVSFFFGSKALWLMRNF